MKLLNIVVSSLVIFSVFAAEARSVKMTALYNAPIEKVRITKNAKYSSFARIENSFRGGSVALRVNLRDKEDNFLVVTAYARTRCAPNMRCIGLPAPVIVKVPYQKFELNHCGAGVYSGVLDERPVDGNRTEIILIDNSTNKCRYVMAIPATQVIVKEKTSGHSTSGRSYEAITDFSAGKLETIE